MIEYLLFVLLLNAIVLATAYGALRVYKYAIGEEMISLDEAMEIAESLSDLAVLRAEREWQSDEDVLANYEEYLEEEDESMVSARDEYIDRILKYKEELENADTYEYEEETEVLLNKLAKVAHDSATRDYPPGVEIITNEHERQSER